MKTLTIQEIINDKKEQLVGYQKALEADMYVYENRFREGEEEDKEEFKVHVLNSLIETIERIQNSIKEYETKL